MYLLLTIRLYLLTISDCLDRAGHSDSEVQKGRNPELFVLASATKPMSMVIFPASYSYAN